MKYATLVKENIRHQKAGFIGITILVFLITLALCGVAAILNNSESYVEQEMDRLGYGDISSWVRVLPGEEELKEQIESLPEVEKVTAQPFLFTGYYVKSVENSNNSDGMVMEFKPSENTYYIYNNTISGRVKEPEKLKSGEMYVPVSFRALYDLQIGDIVALKITGDEDVLTYTVKGYFEDPVMGSSMTGIKTLLVCKEDLETVKERLNEAGEKAVGCEAEWLHIFQADPGESTAYVQGKLNENTDLSQYSLITYAKSGMMGFMLILQKIFAGLLLAFVAVFFVVTVLVLGHSIHAGIEQDYSNLGILMALGFTGKDLLRVKLMQYLLPIFIGIVFGIPASMLEVRLVNHMTVEASGIMAPANLPVGICALMLGAMLLVFAVIIFAKVKKVGKISPIRAIRGGAGDVYFKSRFTTPLAKRGLGVHLALRQLVSGKRQYLSVCAVALLLVFSTSLLVRLDVWMGPDGQGIMESFNTADYDIGIRSSDPEVFAEAEQIIYSYGEVSTEFDYGMMHGSIGNMDYVMNVISSPEYYHILKGRTCRYDNEAVVTESVAKDQQVGIGDTIQIEYDGQQADFLITGIYQCANDMGANFGIGLDGYRRLTGGTGNTAFSHCYLFADDVDVESLIAELENRFGDALKVDDAHSWSGIDVIVSAAQGIAFLMDILTVVFVFVVIIMTGSRILYQEQHDLGIYKALGFMAGRLRNSFALRFGMASLLGAVLGMIASALFTAPVVTAMLRYCGIVNFSAHLTFWEAAKPGIFVVVLFLVFAWAAAGKIKKVDPKILIAE